MRGSRDFVSFIFFPAHFTVYRGDPMVLLLRKLYLYCTKDPKGVHYFPGGGVKLFPGGGGGGPNANLFRNPCTYLLFSGGGGGGFRTPYPPLDPHMGNVIITGQYLSQSRF